jgi:predicted TIM-barrel fold metal-dependent hydrolase
MVWSAILKILDFRLRPPIKSFLKCGFFNEESNPFAWHSPWPESALKRSMPMLLKEVKSAGVDSAVVWGRTTLDPDRSTSNDDVAEIVREHGDLFLAGFGGICPASGKIGESVREVERCAKTLGLKGITLEPSFGMRPLAFADDPILYPIYELMQDLGLILALTISRGSPPGQTLRHSNPEAIDRMAGEFPRMKIVISHACWPWVEQSCGLAFRRQNVYLQPDLYGMGMPGTTEWVEAANSHLQDRMIFGSAYPYQGVPEMVNAYLNLPYRPEVMEKVMYKNAARLLEIEN